MQGNCNVIEKQNDSARIRNKIRSGFKMKCFLTLSHWEIQINYRYLTLLIGHDKWNKETGSLPKEFGTYTWHTHIHRQTPMVTRRATLLHCKLHPLRGQRCALPTLLLFALLSPQCIAAQVSSGFPFFFFFLASGSGCLPDAPWNFTNIGPMP